MKRTKADAGTASTTASKRKKTKKDSGGDDEVEDNNAKVMRLIFDPTDACDVCRVHLKADKCEHKVCAICLDTIEIGKMAVIPCSHLFCRVCIDGWIATKNDRGKASCPMCSKRFLHYNYFDAEKKDPIGTVLVRPSPPPPAPRPAPASRFVRYEGGTRVDSDYEYVRFVERMGIAAQILHQQMFVRMNNLPMNIGIRGFTAQQSADAAVVNMLAAEPIDDNDEDDEDDDEDDDDS